MKQMKQSSNLGEEKNPYSIAIKTIDDPNSKLKTKKVQIEFTAPPDSILINGIYLEWRAFKLNAESESEPAPAPSSGSVKFNYHASNKHIKYIKYTVPVDFEWQDGVYYYCKSELYRMILGEDNIDPNLTPNKNTFIYF